MITWLQLNHHMHSGQGHDPGPVRGTDGITTLRAVLQSWQDSSLLHFATHLAVVDRKCERDGKLRSMDPAQSNHAELEITTME